MPKKRIVIHPNHLPLRHPFTDIAVLALVLDRLNAPGWVCGIFSALCAMIVLNWYLDLRNQDRRQFPGN